MELSDIKIFIPYGINRGSGTYYESEDRRLVITFTMQGNILIIDQYYNEGVWQVSQYASTLDFPINALPSLTKQLDRLEKLLILK